jgi:hypothetical protein
MHRQRVGWGGGGICFSTNGGGARCGGTSLGQGMDGQDRRNFCDFTFFSFSARLSVALLRSSDRALALSCTHLLVPTLTGSWGRGTRRRWEASPASWALPAVAWGQWQP